MMLTKRQKEILDYLKKYISENGYAPTFEEIASHFSFHSKGTVYKHIKTLQKKGVIKHQWNRTRAIEIESPRRTSAGPDQRCFLPLVGHLTESEAILPVDNIQEVEVPSTFIGEGGHFVLLIVGNFLADEYIMDGDYVVIKEKSTANEGEKVLLIWDRKPAIKIFYSDRNQVNLKSANPSIPPQSVPRDSFQILGSVVMVMRKF